ncbi:DUF7507 domain-containing protein [Arthrobacter bambusae]|uniref:DUF7507 domain-containing protein n=1 Tax=Arthrobacter bambusae TaxID=1338426 RepID=A0AAW8DF89_9MICC|nr:hypothetical protein [Arthrobacter bambusae]MDP9904566.1 hypothetical protein [Arthrobacter bambusae]MDQ0129381.1 hypothetical protein [Arthrobacter bambusae]MDQ0181006.1 hypothetical protein [Arthrobacter bambusae]
MGAVRKRRSLPVWVGAVAGLVGVLGGGLLGYSAAPATAAGPSLVWEARAGACYLSWQDTDPATGASYFIVESSGHPCRLTVTDPAGAQVTDLTVTDGQAVVYPESPGTFSYSLTDLALHPFARGTVAVTQAPVPPAPGPGAVTAGGCTKSFEQRTVAGHLATYSSGWSVLNGSAAASCAGSVSALPYAATVAQDTVQVAVLDPYGITLSKSVTDVAGTPISTAAEGQAVRFDFLVANTGTVPWTVTITDPLPGLGQVVCPARTLAPQASETCTADYTVTAADAAAGKVVNTATATGTDSSGSHPSGASALSAPSTVTLSIASTPSPSPSPSPSTTPTQTQTPTAAPTAVPSPSAGSTQARTLPTTASPAPASQVGGGAVVNTGGHSVPQRPAWPWMLVAAVGVLPGAWAVRAVMRRR